MENELLWDFLSHTEGKWNKRKVYGIYRHKDKDSISEM